MTPDQQGHPTMTTTIHHPACELEHEPSTGCAQLIQRPPTSPPPNCTSPECVTTRAQATCHCGDPICDGTGQPRAMTKPVERTWTFTTIDQVVQRGDQYLDPAWPRIIHSTHEGPRSEFPWPVIKVDSLRETTADTALYQEALAEINRLRALVGAA